MRFQEEKHAFLELVKMITWAILSNKLKYFQDYYSTSLQLKSKPFGHLIKSNAIENLENF